MANPNPDRRNLRPWKPGQSGNPNGRPKSLTSILRDLMDRQNPAGLTAAEAFVQACIIHAANGNAAYAKEIWARMDGLLAPAEPERDVGYAEIDLDAPDVEPRPDEGGESGVSGQPGEV